MSNNTTPMQLLKHHINVLKKSLNNCFDNFNLQKSSPKYNPYRNDYYAGGDSLGVDSDFILIFKEKDGYSSFAIIFDYMDKEVKDWNITISYKPINVDHNPYVNQDKEKKELNKNIISSLTLSVPDFKETLKIMNTELTNKPSVEDVTAALKAHFLADIQENKVGEELEKELKIIQVELSDEFDNLTILKSELDITKSEHSIALGNAVNETNATDQSIRAEELRHELAQLDQVIAEQKEVFMQKYDVANLSALAKEAYGKFDRCRFRVNDKVTYAVQKRPSYLRKKLTKKLIN